MAKQQQVKIKKISADTLEVGCVCGSIIHLKYDDGKFEGTVAVPAKTKSDMDKFFEDDEPEDKE